jgi:branched-chain amino acid transport system ATP-binding protein
MVDLDSGEPTMAILEIRNLSRRFGKLVALSDLSFSIHEGQITSLIGPNGAGKTTFYNVITGKFPPSSGSILFQGKDISGLPPHKIWRLGIARSFQITNIFMRLTVLENIRSALIVHLNKTYNFLKPIHYLDQLHERSLQIVNLVGLQDKMNMPCHAISHGDMRIVEVGIVLASEPKLAFLDEPTQGMTPGETMKMANLIRELHKKTGTTFFITEHDMKVVFAISDRIIVLDRGTLLAEGTPQEIHENIEVKKAYLGGLKQ